MTSSDFLLRKKVRADKFQSFSDRHRLQQEGLPLYTLALLIIVPINLIVSVAVFQVPNVFESTVVCECFQSLTGSLWLLYLILNQCSVIPVSVCVSGCCCFGFVDYVTCKTRTIIIIVPFHPLGSIGRPPVSSSIHGSLLVLWLFTRSSLLLPTPAAWIASNCSLVIQLSSFPVGGSARLVLSHSYILF